MSEPKFYVGQCVSILHCGKKVSRTIREITPEGKSGLIRINKYDLWIKPRRVLPAANTQETSND